MSNVTHKTESRREIEPMYYGMQVYMSVNVSFAGRTGSETTSNGNEHYMERVELTIF